MNLTEAWNKLTPVQRLCALYNCAKPLGMGFLHFIPGDITEEEAQKLMKRGDDHGTKDGHFDYLEGRLMKTSVVSEEPMPTLYNRDNGENAFEDAIIGYAERLGNV